MVSNTIVFLNHTIVMCIILYILEYLQHFVNESYIIPRALEQWPPTAPGACSQCVFTTHCCVCVHLDGLNAEDQFRVWVTILDNTSQFILFIYFLLTIVN